MKNKIRKWLGISALEEKQKLDRTYLQGEVDRLDDELMITEGKVEEDKSMKYAVHYILHYLKLGWQIEITRTPEKTSSFIQTQKQVLKPLDEIKYRVVFKEEGYGKATEEEGEEQIKHNELFNPSKRN